jgi:hypothetical protein
LEQSLCHFCIQVLATSWKLFDYSLEVSICHPWRASSCTPSPWPPQSVPMGVCPLQGCVTHL